MSAEKGEQGVLFGFEQLMFNPRAESSVAKLHAAWTNLSEAECLEKATQSPLELIRNSWKELCPPLLARQVDEEYVKRQSEQQQILWDYWAGVILQASKGLEAPMGVNFQATKDSDHGYTYVFNVREEDAHSSFEFVFVPTTNTIDWGHKFPTMDTIVNGGNRNYLPEEEYHCVFRRGDFTLIEKTSEILNPEGTTAMVRRYERIQMARP